MKNRHAVIGGANPILLEGIRQIALSACQISTCVSHPVEWLRAVANTGVELAIVDATEKGWEIATLLDRLPPRDIAVIALVPGTRLYDYASMIPASRRHMELLPATVSADTLLGTVKRLLDDLERSDSPPPSALVASLTERQQNILHLLCMGESTKRIAGLLNISTRTVEFHKYRMMKALGVTSTTQLVLLGVEAGIGTPAARSAGAASAAGNVH